MPIEPELPAQPVTFGFPTEVRFGAGVINELGPRLRAAGARKPLVVTDRGLVETDAFRRAIAGLGGLEHRVFAGVEPNPLAEQADLGAAEYAAGGCDAVVGLGGGSALDVAKVVRVIATHGGAALDYDYARGGLERITARMPYFVAVPTTAGTGSEVGRSGVVTCPDTRTKRTVFSPFLLAPLVLADPELTLGLPARVTADTGMDALTHAVEAYLTPGFHPMCDGIALQAVGMIGGALRRAVQDGGDLAARASMMAAALMGAVAFQKGLGATHALAHPLSTLAGLPHGRANGVLLPHLLRFNAQVVGARVRDLGRALADDDDAAGAVAALGRDVGLPADLRAAGVDPALLDDLVEQALGEPLLHENPRPVSAAEVRALYEEAFGG